MMSNQINRLKSLQLKMMSSFLKKSNKKYKKKKKIIKKLRINLRADAYLKRMMFKNHHQEPYYQMIQ